MLSAEVDIPNFTGLGIGAVVLGLVFRTLWQQSDGWRAVLDAARTDAKSAREEAAAARADATHARMDASEARAAESECRRRLSKLEAEMAALQRVVERRTKNQPPPDGVDKRGDQS